MSEIDKIVKSLNDKLELLDFTDTTNSIIFKQEIKDILILIQDLGQENQQLKEHLDKEKKIKIENWKPMPDDLLDMLNQELVNQLQQGGSIIEETIHFCYYLLENNEVEINGKKYFKHSCDDIITNAILEILKKYKGESNE